MYNYYTDLKRKEKLEEEEKKKEKEKRDLKKREKRMEKFTKNYEKRIQNFIYQMAEKPILLREIKKPFSTTREELLFEESNKILFHKGFTNNLYHKDRDKINKYKEYEEREKFFTENNFHNYRNSLSLEKLNKNYLNKTINSSYNNSYNNIINNNNNNLNSSDNNNIKKSNISQPEMRFRARTDLERIYNVLSNYRPSQAGKKSKKIIENQLNNLVKAKIIQNDSTGNKLNDNENNVKSIEEILEEINHISKNEKNNKFNKNKNVKKRVDNSNAKNLHSDLYNKTYFNAIEHYSIFKNSCFLPKRFNKTFNEENNNDSNLEKKNKKYKIKKTFLKSFQKTNEEENYTPKNNFNLSSPNDIINLINNSKQNIKEDNIIKSLDNIDLFIQGLKEQKPKLTKKEQINFDKIKLMAFSNKKKNFPLIETKNKNEENLNNSFSNDNEDLFVKKPEEKIKINGIEYLKNDLENLSKAIMENCKFTRKKYRIDDSNYSHSGNGKLMFTNGLTLKEFEKKYHIKP